MTNSVCVIFASFQPEVQSFGALAQSTNSPAVRILPSDFKSLRLRARHAFGTFGEYRTRQKDYDRASASKSDYWVGNPNLGQSARWHSIARAHANESFGTVPKGSPQVVSREAPCSLHSSIPKRCLRDLFRQRPPRPARTAATRLSEQEQ